MASIGDKKKKRPRVSSQTMRVRVYDILTETIEQGIAYGWNRSHKHTDKPDEWHVREQIYQAIMNEICEKFDFDDGDVAR